MPIQAHHALKDRLNAVWIVAALAGAVLGLRLMQLQLVDHLEYNMAAESNRTKMIYQTAPRGRIYDRNGVPLATNAPAFSLIYLPRSLKDTSELKPLSRELGRQLGQDPDKLLDTLEQAEREETALRLAENLPPKTMFRLSELKTIYPGIDLIVEARRYYPFGRFASHLLGYMGKMDARSWRELKNKGYRVDSRIGRMGLEAIFENELRGRDGGIRMEVDAQGRMKRILERIPWEPGSDIHLTIDKDIQQAADDGLHHCISGRGAVVVLDPRSGAILALSSAPDFDPNALLSSDPSVVSKTVADLPEFNHAISGTYAPGSTFKTIVSAAGLETGKINPKETVFCPGYFQLGKRIFKCWNHKGHGAVDFLTALEQSCDVYYYRMGLRMGGDLIEKYARMFGLGQKTDVALRGEVSGHLFGPRTRALANRGWYDGDTVNLSIGQGELLVTPIQMADVAAAIASRGTLWRPHYTERIVYNDGRPDYVQKPERSGQIKLSDKTWDLLWHAMQLVVTSGTAHAEIIPGLTVMGKTGTAQNPHGKDHSWFIGFARRNGEPTPTLALAVLVENGGESWDSANPIARKVLMAAFHISEKQRAAPAAVGPALRPPMPAVSPAAPMRTL